MTVSFSRRDLLGAGVAVGASATLAKLNAAMAATLADWRLGFQNAPAGGVGPTAMRRLHGRTPRGLHGALYRNGPGQFRWGDNRLGHWFDGDGLIRKVSLRDGQAQLSARFIDTPKRRNDSAAQDFVTPGFGTAGKPTVRMTSSDDTNAANTAILQVKNQMWALWEAGSPFGFDAETLATTGLRTLRDDLAHMPFSAHPKVEPSGRVWNFGLGFGGQQAFLWALTPDGAVENAGVIPLPRKAYLHDWAVSRTKLILPLQPWISTGGFPIVRGLQWKPEQGMAVLVVDKADFSKTRVYELPAAAFFHTGDAWEDADGTIRFDVCLSDAPSLDAERGGALARAENPPPIPRPDLALVTLRPNGRAEVERLPLPAEFPRADPRQQGEGHGVVYFASHSPGQHSSPFGFDSIASHDWRTGRSQSYVYGPTQMVEEHVFVAKSPRANDGWLVGATLNLAAQAMEVHVLDAARLADGPIVSFRAPTPLPLGFHGIWVG